MQTQSRPNMITVVMKAPAPRPKKQPSVAAIDLSENKMKNRSSQLIQQFNNQAFQPIIVQEEREWVPVRPKLVMNSLLLDEQRASMLVTPTTMPTTNGVSSGMPSASRHFDELLTSSSRNLREFNNVNSERCGFMGAVKSLKPPSRPATELACSAKPPRVIHCRTSKHIQSQNLCEAIRNLKIDPRISNSQKHTPRQAHEHTHSSKSLHRQPKSFTRMENFSFGQHRTIEQHDPMTHEFFTPSQRQRRNRKSLLFQPLEKETN